MELESGPTSCSRCVLLEIQVAALKYRIGMVYRSTREVVEDLRKHGRLIEVSELVSPLFEMTEFQRRVYCEAFGSDYARSRMAVFYQPIWESFAKELESLTEFNLGAISA